MNLRKRWKIACSALLAACCLGTAAAGLALTGATTAAAAEAATGWAEGGSKVGDVTVFTSSSSVRSNVNILSLPGNTGVFYMYYSDASSGWSGFSLRNGNEGNGYTWTLEDASETAFPWHSLCFDHGNNHMIFQDNRIFTSTGGTLGGVKGVEGENFLQGMIPVEIHVGAGQAQGDASYVKIGGVELKQEDDATQSITLPWTRASGTSKELTASMFPQGCYVTVNYNVGSEPVHEFALSDVGSISTTDASFDKTQTHQAEGFTQALTATLTSTENAFAEGYTVTAKVNGHDIPASSVTVTKTSDKQAAVSISAEKLNQIARTELAPSSYFSFHVQNGGTDYGSAVVGTNIVFEAPPVFAAGSEEKTLTAKEPFTYTFTYSGENDPTEMEISYTISTTPVALTSGTDFTVEKGSGDEYTVTITQAGVDKIFNGHAAAALTLTFGPHTFRSSAFIDGQVTEYGIRFREGIDYVDNTLHIDEFYASASLQKHNPATLSSRIFYENGVDVSKPIFIEYGTLDPKVEWMLISLMSSPKISETFSNETGPAAGNIVSFIMFGNDRHNLQGMNNTFVNPNTTEFGQNTNMKNNVVEVFIGQTAAQGYVRVNGETVEGAVLSKTQADFPSGKAYVGLFFNNGAGPFDFTCNTHVNAVAITAPQADSAYTMDLGNAKDFPLTLANTSGNLKLTDESGNVIPASDWTYAEGKLTIKTSYFSGKSFTREGRIFIWDNEKETGTAFKMAYTSSGMSAGKIEYVNKGSVSDVTFTLDADVTKVTDKDGTALDTSKYTVNGKSVTVKKEAIADEVGVQTFLISAGSKIYPCFVYVNDWNNGFAAAEGASVSGGTLTLNGKTSVAQAKTYDLTQGFEMNFEIKTADVFAERGANDPATSITVRFFDPFSGNTLYFTVYANFDNGKITTNNQALYLSFGVLNGEGNPVAGSTGKRPVAPNDGKNTAFASHALKITENNGGIKIQVAEGSPINLSSAQLNGFNLSACVLSVTTESSTDGSVAVAYLSGTTTGTGGNEKKGCGGAISSAAAAVIAAGTLIAAAAVVVRRNKNKN